jgi:putative phage-type endonuclease
MIVQGTPEWYAARAGKVTASRIADLTAKQASGKVSALRATYMGELLCERLTGICEPGYVSPAMQWGKDVEPAARQAYGEWHDIEVYEVGFVDHAEIPMSGCSPDGLVGECGLVEIKAPNSATHIETLDTGRVPPRYMPQIQWQLACTGRQWCDFVSFDPRLPLEMQLFIQRVPRDLSAILTLETEVTDFIRELDGKVARLRAQYAVREAA